MKQIVADIEADAAKFYNQNNGAAGTMVRRAMQDVKVLAGDIRKEITEKKMLHRSSYEENTIK